MGKPVVRSTAFGGGVRRHRVRTGAGRKISSVAALAILSATACAAAWLTSRYQRWGASDSELMQPLPGDALLPTPDVSTTRAITINSVAEDVWPWIAQLGQGRGGFYSYDRLENIVARIDIHNADRIVPEWQQVAVGSEVRLAPQVPLRVATLEPGRALVLRGGVPMGRTAPPYDFTWAFVLLPDPPGATRLIVRERYTYTHRWTGMLVQPVQLVSSLMSRKMLLGIRARCERPPGPNAALRFPSSV